MPEPTLDSLGLTRLEAHGPEPEGAAQVAGIAVDSRAVRPGFVFVAIPGHRLDGAGFAQYAVRQGALAVVVTPEGLDTARRDIGELPVPFFLSDNPRAELARLAAAFHGRQPEVMVAVTGTNGKTSVAQFTRQLWAALGDTARPRSARRASLARASTNRSPSPRQSRWRCTRCWRASPARAARTPPWRRRATAWPSTASTACAWPRQPSPTSAETISTITPAMPTMSPPRCGSSPSCCRRAAPPCSTPATRCRSRRARSASPAASTCWPSGRAPMSRCG